MHGVRASARNARWHTAPPSCSSSSSGNGSSSGGGSSSGQQGQLGSGQGQLGSSSSDGDDASSSNTIELKLDGTPVTIDLRSSGVKGARRTRLVMYTCDKCGVRSSRNVNPVAWDRGMVYGQCSNPDCAVWHVLKVSDPKLMEEVVIYDQSEREDGSISMVPE
ncbi:hypothetical protein FOA52_010180 [Chlamydomonas sp. UWO 241]|nr:hypothetical protein FOA52_010180 [Chlamydomonas sp. UWO 241]